MRPTPRDGVTAAGVICAFNEERNIGRAVRTLQVVQGLDEVLVVDGHSEDRTASRAERAGARVVEQHVAQYPGKGIAVETALDETDQDVLLFFDADIHNMEPWQPQALLDRVRNGHAEHALARFTRKGGRVTELTAKPLFRIFFPEVRFQQPLTGEFAARRDVLTAINVVRDWGVEAGMVIDLSMAGVHVEEVDTGHKQHPMKPLADLRVMAEQVARTVVQKAEEYGRLGRARDQENLNVESVEEVMNHDVAPLSV